jgi:outer membrane protein assembly factor BamB
MEFTMACRGAHILWSVLGLAACGALAVRGDDWPGWRGPARSGKSAETGLLKTWPVGGPALLWKASGIGKGFSSVAVVKGTVYTTGDVGGDLKISALDDTGRILWQQIQGPAFTASHGGARSTPVVDGNRIYLVGGSGRVTCHDAATQQLVWERELKSLGGAPGGWGYSESALIVDDKVIVTPGGSTGIVALDKRTGQDVWRGDAPCKAHYCSAIVIRDQTHALIVQGTGSGLLALDPKDGRRVWSSDFSAGNTANCPDPAYADGYLFWANGYGKGGICFKVECREGAWLFTEAWRTGDMICHHGGYVIDKGYIYGNHNAGWSCLDLKTGQPAWKNQKGVGKGSICLADGLLFLFGENGGKAGLATASPEAFAMRGEVTVQGAGPSWAHPVVADGRLYLRYDDSLYCFDVKGR